MEGVTNSLGCILDVILVNNVRRVLLLRANDLACDLVVVAVESLPQDLAADRVKLCHEMCGKKSQVVLLEDNGASLLYLQSG